MKPAFLLSSAIHTRFGVFTAEQRLDQTINTLKSIRSRVPDAQIIIFESSGKSSVTQEELDKLTDADIIINFHNEPTVKFTHDSTDNWDIVKNYTEMIVFHKGMQMLQSRNILEGCDRIFKMSGRYNLTDSFDPAIYDANPNSIIMSKRRASQFPAGVTGGITEQFMSRLWSFPAADLSNIIVTYEQMIMNFQSRISDKGYADIEHLLFKHLPRTNLLEVDVVGVEGQIGPTAGKVSD